MRKGVKFRREGVPIVRRTLAPAPSDCSRARCVLTIDRGVDMAAVDVKDLIVGDGILCVGFPVYFARLLLSGVPSAFEARFCLY